MTPAPVPRGQIARPGDEYNGTFYPVTESEIIQRTSVREQAQRILRAKVLTGELVPDEVYSAVALAEEMNVSPTPIREAMLDLVNAGLVKAVRNRGFRVVAISREDLDEIVTLRLWLEVPAMAVVVDAASGKDINGLKPLAQNIVDAARAHDVAGFLVADQDFHRTLLGLTGNRRLVRVVGDLRDQTQLLGLSGLNEAGQLEDSGQEHFEIINALAARNRGLAMAVMTRHLEHARGIWSGMNGSAAADGGSAPPSSGGKNNRQPPPAPRNLS